MLLITLAFGSCLSQYDDYGSDYGEGGWGSGGDSGSDTTTTPMATTKAPTTSKPSGKTVVFPKLTSPVAGYKYTKVFGVPVFAHSSVSDVKFQHIASIMAE